MIKSAVGYVCLPLSGNEQNSTP